MLFGAWQHVKTNAYLRSRPLCLSFKSPPTRTLLRLNRSLRNSDVGRRHLSCKYFCHRLGDSNKPIASRLLQSRLFHFSIVARHKSISRPESGTGITIHFKDSKGEILKTVEANEGDDILSIAHEYDIDLEGACEGSVACSTCHVILPPEYYDLLPEPEDDENDMLDMAFGLTDTSRLGCQVKLTRELDGMTATLPSATRNMFVDGKKPTH